jgi:hypothetical protein
MRARTIGAAVVILLVASGPASGHGAGVGYRDPNDHRYLDILSTKKSLVHIAEGHHRWRFTVVTDFVTSVWIVRVLVDSRAGHQPDFVLIASKLVGDPQCVAKRPNGRPISLRCDANVDGRTAWWSIRRRVLDPDKPIRWRVATPDVDSLAFSDPTDLAPDAGWYV